MDQGDSGGAHIDSVSNRATEAVTDSLTDLGTKPDRLGSNQVTNPAIDSRAIQ
jgi:hypothetical protein